MANEEQTPKQATEPSQETAPVAKQPQMEPPGQKTAYPLPSFRWKEIDLQGSRILQQAHRVEQNNKIIGVLWSDVPTEPFVQPV